MMFWIGFATGVSAAFFIFAAFTWMITKERAESAKALMEYRQQSMKNQEAQIAVLENIQYEIRTK